MRILILGGSGRIGSELLTAAERRHWPHLGTYHTRPRAHHVPLTLRDSESVNEIVADYDPDAVIWAAPALPDAMTDVLAAVAQTSATFAFVSGDGVFGECKQAMREEDELNPVGEWAGAQAACEQLIRAALPERHLIARSSFVYGTRSKTDRVAQLLRLLAKGETVLADDEAVRMPTFAPDLAEAVLSLLSRPTTGTYHLVGSERHTEFSFARTVAMIGGMDADLVQQRPAFEQTGPVRVSLDRFKALSVLGRKAFRSVGEAIRVLRDRQREAAPVRQAA